MPETRAENPDKIQFKKIILQYKNMLSNKSFMILALKAQCFFASMIAWIAAGPFLLIDRFHLSTMHFGIIQGIVFSGFIIAARAVKHLMTKFDLHAIINFGTGLAIFGSVYFVTTSLIWPNAWGNAVLAMMLIAGGTGLAFPILNRLSIEASEEPMGSRVAISSFLMGISSTLASAIMSFVYNDTLLSLAATVCAFSFLSIGLHFFKKN